MPTNNQPNITNRPYRGPADLDAILDLVRARPRERILDYPSIADLQELMALPDVCEQTYLWETADHLLAGFAHLESMQTFASLRFETRRGFDNGELDEEMLTWGEQHFTQDYHGVAVRMSISAHLANRRRVELLERHGFVHGDFEVIKLERCLADPIPAPSLLPGYTIRSLCGEAEAPAWVTLHRAAFGTENMTVDYKLSMMRIPDYDPALDLVAVAPDGSLEAYVVGWFNREENQLSGLKLGYTDPIAAHPDHQRKGLSRALLLTALNLLKARGLDVARTSTGSDNLALLACAQSVGFAITDRFGHFEKKLKK